MAESHSTLFDEASVLELHRFWFAFNLNEDAQLWRKRPRNEEREFMGWLELFLPFLRRGGVFKEPALHTQGEAIDQCFKGAVLFEALDQSPGGAALGS